MSDVGDYPCRGDIYWVDFDPARGSEQAGRRPACVISLDSFNKNMPVVVVAAITSKVNRSRLALYLPAGRPLMREGEVLPFQVVTIDQSRLEDKIGSLQLDQIHALEAKLRLSWGL